MIDTRLLAFSAVALALTITPGADTMLVIRNALRGGRRDGVATTLGITSGLVIHAVFSALGLSIILAESAAAFNAVKLVGAVYLAWLGLVSLRRALRGRGPAPDAPAAERAPIPFRRSWLEGFLTNILNPKVAVFYLAFLPQFIEPGDPVLLRSFTMAFIHYTMGIVWLGGITVVVSRARRWLGRSSVRRWLDGTSGTILVALGVRLALERR